MSARKVAILFLVFILLVEITTSQTTNNTNTDAHTNNNTNNTLTNTTTHNANTSHTNTNTPTQPRAHNHTNVSEKPVFKVGMVNDVFLKFASQDNQIYNGTMWWADWVNKRGGLVYDGVAHRVKVVALDASTPNPALVFQQVMDAYQKLVEVYNVDLLLAPATTDRTNASIQISEKYGIINLVSGAQTPSFFKSTNSFIFTSATPPFMAARVSFDLLIQKGAKTFIVLMRPDTIAVNQGATAIAYLTSMGLTMVKKVWMNSTSVDLASLDSDLRDTVSNHILGVEADILIYCALQTEFSAIASVVEQVRPTTIKSAVFLISCSRFEQTFHNLGQTGDYWILGARFDPSFHFGVSGEYGGTTQEFFEDFQENYGIPPSLFDAIAPGLLMGYYRAVNIAGTINASVVRATLKNMSEFETFAFPLKFQKNGTNQFAQYIPLQNVNGQGRPLTFQNLIYPAVWEPRDSSGNVKKIVAIAVPIGVVILVAVGIGVLYIRHQREHVVLALEQAEEGERRNYKIDFNSLTLLSLIGAGSFGFVYKGEYRGADVAIKKLKSPTMSPEQLDQFARESSVMIGLRHPNILLFMGVCVEPPELCIVTEFCSRGSLYEIIHNDKISLPLPLIKNMLEDTLKGMLFIHAAGFIHRDFKSPNLLVDRNWGIKISDFGLSCLKSKADDEAQVSLLWTAPEVLSQQDDCYSEKSDIYAFGIVVWELMARKVPYDNLQAAAIPTAVLRGERPPINLQWDGTLRDLMQKCWDPIPVSRVSVKEARGMVEGMYIDPDFQTSSSSALAKYAEKVPPPTGTVTFVNTVMLNVSELWEHDPRVMMRSLLLHYQLLRGLMDKYKGYEVRSNGDSFMIAFPDPLLAINFCLRAQTGLLNIHWPEILLRHQTTKAQTSTKGKVIFKGLSTKMGIYTTNPTIEKNQETGTMDYLGNNVTRAACLASVAAKGRIMIDSNLYAKAMSSIPHLDAFVMHSVGPIVLPKSNSFDVYEMVPESLKERIDLKEVRDEITPGDDFPYTELGRFEFPPPRDRWILNYSDLRVGEKIGVGTFGEVRCGTLRGERVAIKELIKQKVNIATIVELRAESAILSMLQHENVLTFKGMCLKEPHLCMVTEFMENGTLARILYGSSTIVPVILWDLRKRMIIDIVRGMAYLHSKSIIHRDIKSFNMLVNADMRVKIADFGFSRIKAENQTMTQCGTVAWTAPEIFEGSHYSEQADVYSFGIVLWEIIFRTKPWLNTHAMRITQAVIAGKRPPTANPPLNTPPEMLILMESCWQQQPQERPTFAKILEELQKT